ncbi:MAG: hypothetical protein LIR46_03050 [Bacteroidota bacterium]|nr:hypothetical protein [Bacteroidota bacterium]
MATESVKEPTKKTYPREYRKKPVIITAIQYTGGNLDDIMEFVDPEMISFEKNIVTIHTLEGGMIISVNDWVIRGVKGEFYPCKPDIFEATYEQCVKGE